MKALNTKLEEDKANDIEKFESEIKHLLKIEILTRYYYQKGKIIANLSDDNYMKEAIELLKNKERYTTLFQVDTIGVY